MITTYTYNEYVEMYEINLLVCTSVKNHNDGGSMDDSDNSSNNNNSGNDNNNNNDKNNNNRELKTNHSKKLNGKKKSTRGSQNRAVQEANIG